MSTNHSFEAHTTVPVYPLVETWNVSELVASFAQVHILLSLFDGDPTRWEDCILQEGTDEEIENDLPFVRRMKTLLGEHPGHVARLRTLLREFSQLVASS